MQPLGSAATAAVINMLTDGSGINANLASLSSPDSQLVQTIEAAQVHDQNIAADLAERSTIAKYPALYVYCDRLLNNQAEKFRSFSGTAQMTIEIRHSKDRLDDLQTALQLYVDSVSSVLAQAQGDWGNGMFYAGGYEVTFGPVKHGGRNFLQVGKISFQVQVSRN